ncbi:endochitinase A-like [Oryza brachyantha]|nr:endochitinase A-like [Oryza brachyantha]
MAGNKHNIISQHQHHVLDCPTPQEGNAADTSKRRKNKPAGGFNLRKSIAWNPAFFTEQGVLDNTELSMLTGSQVKATRSPASGFSSTFSPLSRLEKSGNTPVLKEVAQNSRGKFPAKCLSTENKGRKLFASSKVSEQDERKAPAGTQDKRSAKNIQKSIPRPPAGYAQKKVPNSSATAQISRIPRKSQPSPSVVSRTRSTSSVTDVPKPTKKPATAKSKYTHKVEAPPLKSETENPSVGKSSGPTIGKDAVPTVTTTCEEASCSGKYKTFSPVSQDKPSNSVVVPVPMSAKPSALRMPSPSVGFFAQGKTSASHGNTAQNPEKCFSGNISSLRYKQPVDLKGRFHLTKWLPSNRSVSSNIPAQPATSDITPKVLASSFTGFENTDACSVKQSLSESIIPYSVNSGNTNIQEIADDGFLLAGNGATTQQLSSVDNNGASNDMPNECNVVTSVEQHTIKDVEPIEGTNNLNVICCSSIELEPAEGSCFQVVCSLSEPTVGSKLTTSCISSPGCTPNDLNCQGKSDCEATVNLENSLSGETPGTVCSSEGNNCTLATSSLRDSHSCYQQNMLVQSIHCTDQMPQCDSSRDPKPSLAHIKLDSNDSLCSEVQLTSSEGPNIDIEMELDTDDALDATVAPLLHVGGEFDIDYRSAECSPMNLAVRSPYVDQEARSTNLIEKADIEGRTESHHSSTKERRPLSPVEQDTDDKIEFDTKKMSSEGVSNIEMNKPVGKSRTNTISKDHLKNLVPFTEEWLAVMEAFGEEVLEQKSGAVQNSPTDKAAPEPSPWSPVKRKAQDVGPFDCTKYSKSVRTSDSP